MPIATADPPGAPTREQRPANADRRWIAEHESAHATAAFLLGRRIASVSILPNDDSGGRAVIETLKKPQTVDEGVIDIAIVLAGDVLAGHRGLGLEWAESGGVLEDESRAFDIASRIAGVDALEWRAIVELGRARAAVLAERDDFKAGMAALAPVLLQREEIPGDEVEAVLWAAINQNFAGSWPARR
jgi:hypothetical protein